MAELDRTNADAERVSDIVKPVAYAVRTRTINRRPGEWVMFDLHDNALLEYRLARIGDEPAYDVAGLVLADALESAIAIIEAQSKTLAEAREALTDVRLWARNARGAIESDQVVDKDVRGSMNRIMARIDALTPTPENPNG